MLNRVLQVKMVKKSKDDLEHSEQSDEFEGKAAIIGKHLQNLIPVVTNAVIAYIVADTIRQVMVAKASK